jgi:glycosyltransferase involved in cell wall biosynthesis
VPALIREHDVVCVLSRSNEPFGLVVLEAMASGCAVIASNRGGLPEACGGAAVLVSSEDIFAVTDILRNFALDGVSLVEQKQSSKSRAVDASWMVLANAFKRTLEE